ncbi:2522_t:CDS:2, partial [Dentiscutata heterogama]
RDIIVSAETWCYDTNDPLDSDNRTPVRCPAVTETNSNTFHDVGVKPDNSTNMFEIIFTCDPNANQTTCDKAKNSFVRAGEIFSSVLILNTPIRINASLIPLADKTVLGSAAPARLIPLKCKDHKIRNFPQSLVKQFQLPTHPEYSSSDILAVFNSESEFYFENDTTINSEQIGFLELITHEIVHGLGLVTNWKPLLNSNVTTELTPRLNLTTSDTDPTQPLIYYGFIETIFDQFLVTSEGNKFSNFTEQLNKFTPYGTKFQDQTAFINAFINSPQYAIAQSVLNYSQTTNSMVFLANPHSELIWLETSVFPYSKGSSISHFSMAIYDNTTDFLMTYLQHPGRSFETALQENYATCIIGPKLLYLLETIGYATPSHPDPEKPSPIDHATKNQTTKSLNPTSPTSSLNTSQPTSSSVSSNTGSIRVNNNYGWINLVIWLSIGGWFLDKVTATSRTLHPYTKLKPSSNVRKQIKPPPYHPDDYILLVGEGNFSFARTLAESILHTGHKIIATSYDTKEIMTKKYDDAQSNIDIFTECGGQVLYKVDATKLENCKELKNKRFDKIVFNFPHTGLGIKDQDRNIIANQLLIHSFLTSSLNFLTSRKLYSDSKDGEIHITMKTGVPYDHWNIRKLVKSIESLGIKESFEFDPNIYPGYEHRRTLGFKEGVSKKGNEEILEKKPRTFVIVMKEVLLEEDRKRKDDAKDEDDDSFVIKSKK